MQVKNVNNWGSSRQFESRRFGCLHFIVAPESFTKHMSARMNLLEQKWFVECLYAGRRSSRHIIHTYLLYQLKPDF
jgi:hypothetical protein